MEQTFIKGRLIGCIQDVHMSACTASRSIIKRERINIMTERAVDLFLFQ